MSIHFGEVTTRILLYVLVSSLMPAQSGREIVVAWPTTDAAAMALLKDVGATVVLTTPTALRPAPVAGVAVVAELPAAKSLGELGEAVNRARAAGFDGAAVTAVGEQAAFREFLKTQGGFVRFVYLKAEELGWDVAPARAVLAAGNPPGLQAADTGTAAATERPWLDTNLHLYAYLRALCPGREAWLKTKAPKSDARYDSVEVALAEAYASGGNTVLQVPEMFREGLARGNSRAAAAWKSLAQYAAFVENAEGFEKRAPGSSTVIVAGGLDEFEEILNLPYRNNLAPRVAAAGKLPELKAGGTRVAVLVNHPVDPSDAKRVIEYVKEGGILVAAPAVETDEMKWLASAGPKLVKQEKPWSEWGLGKGRIYRYAEPVLDPSEFAFDLREISGLDNPSHTGLHGLDFRVWNASTLLGVLYDGMNGAKTLVLTSYGRELGQDFLVGVRGNFVSGSVQWAGRKPETLKLMQRGWFVEFNLKGIGRQGVIEIKGGSGR